MSNPVTTINRYTLLAAVSQRLVSHSPDLFETSGL